MVDYLQDDVPTTLTTLRKAGIKVWVLTGDKLETAVSIAYAASLISSKAEVFIIERLTSAEELLEKLSRINMHLLGSLCTFEYALVIDGVSLEFALSSQVKAKFLDIALNCKSVLCCRVSALQKGAVLSLVRDTVKEVCLAIGDGANDVW